MTATDPTKIDVDVDPTQRRMRGLALHGNTPFDVPYISEIDENLWQGGCAAGLTLPTFITNVVSLYPWESYTMHGDIASTLMVWMYDSTDQGFDGVPAIARWVNDRRELGPVLVHCQAGLNRSSLIAAYALMLEGVDPAAAIDVIRARRSPACLCNPSFEEWLLAQTLETT
jgi:protein-tyrosine phosphatase